jgi:hypothetical protein
VRDAAFDAIGEAVQEGCDEQARAGGPGLWDGAVDAGAHAVAGASSARRW